MTESPAAPRSSGSAPPGRSRRSCSPFPMPGATIGPSCCAPRGCRRRRWRRSRTGWSTGWSGGRPPTAPPPSSPARRAPRSTSTATSARSIRARSRRRCRPAASSSRRGRAAASASSRRGSPASGRSGASGSRAPSSTGGSRPDPPALSCRAGRGARPCPGPVRRGDPARLPFDAAARRADDGARPASVIFGDRHGTTIPPTCSRPRSPPRGRWATGRRATRLMPAAISSPGTGGRSAASTRSRSSSTARSTSTADLRAPGPGFEGACRLIAAVAQALEERLLGAPEAIAAE